MNTSIAPAPKSIEQEVWEGIDDEADFPEFLDLIT